MKQPCAYCSLPVRCRRVDPATPVFCCTGCAIAFRVPVDSEGRFPVNGALVSALALGFATFNQAMFALMEYLLLEQGKEALALRFGWMSIGTGALVWFALTIMAAKTPGILQRPTNLLLLGGTLGLYLWSGWRGFPELWHLLVANVLLLLGSVRGFLLRRPVSKK